MAGHSVDTLQSDYKALVLGASGGIGSAFIQALEADPACDSVTGISRRRDGLDITDENSIAAAAKNLSGEKFDLVLVATGALHIDGVGPEKSVRAVEADAMMKQFAVNAVGPAMVLKHFLPLVPKDRRAIFACLSARVGSIGDNHIGGWMSYRTAKAGLNQVIRTSSIEAKRKYPELSLVALHPGTVATPLSEPFAAGNRRVEAAQAAADMLRALNGVANGRTGIFLAYDGSEIEW